MPHRLINQLVDPLHRGDPFTGTAEFHRTTFERMGPNGEFHVVEPPLFVDFESVLAATVPPQLTFPERVRR